MLLDVKDIHPSLILILLANKSLLFPIISTLQLNKKRRKILSTTTNLHQNFQCENGEGEEESELSMPSDFIINLFKNNTKNKNKSYGNKNNIINTNLYFPKILSNVKKKTIWRFKLIQFLIFIYFISFYIPIVNATGIGCFVCSSFNGSNPECEDTFNSTVDRGAKGNVANYQFPCWAFKKNRQGLFPADHCIKVSGYKSSDPSQSIVIRTCALDSGTLTADTEIVRISHCGHFKYEGYQYTGCVQSCDTDGCNTISSNYIIFKKFDSMLIAFATSMISLRLFIHLF